MTPAEGSAGFRQALWDALARLPLAVDSAAEARMLRHYELLVSWNRKLNLTRITEPAEAAERHFAESLALLAAVEVKSGARVLEVGSGAGFPGLALAACRPDCKFTLLEPVAKKAVFLREVSRDWGHVEVRMDRLDPSFHVEHRWDWAVMRAVAPVAVLELLAEASERVALWLGEAELAPVQSFSGFHWQAPIALPSGGGRSLLLGQTRRST